MGSRDGEKAAPTTIGTAKPSVNEHAIARASNGTSMTGSNTAANNAPTTAKPNAAASMDAFDHAAKVGRERGRESPIAVSPAMAVLAGRIVASTKLCMVTSEVIAPKTTPTIPYWTSRDPGAPAIAPTTA